MSKNEAKKPKSPTDELVKPISRPLEPRELDQVAGAQVTTSDFHFVMKSNKASPQ